MAAIKIVGDGLLCLLCGGTLISLLLRGAVLMPGMADLPPLLCAAIGAVWFGVLFLAMQGIRRFSKSCFANLMRRPAAIFFCFAALFGMQILLTHSVYSNNGWDSQVVLSAADDFLRGEAYTGTYFYEYPNNLFLLSVYRFFFTVLNMLGIADYLPWAIALGCLCVDLAIGFLFLLTRRLFGLQAAWLSFLMTAPLAGLSPWIAIPYTDTYGIVFPIACLYFYVVCRSDSRRFVRLAAVAAFGFSLATGMKFKPTVIIVAIAIILRELLLLCQTRLAWRSYLRGGLCFALGLALSFGICTAVQQKATGTMLDPVLAEQAAFGLPHYFMMGLSQPYGMYSYEDVEYTKSFSGKQAKTQANFTEAQNRISEMGAAGYAQFLRRKANFVLNDGTFYFGREGGFYLNDAFVQTPLAQKIQRFFRADGENYGILAVWQQAQWLVCLVLVLLGIRKKKHFDFLWIARLSFLGLVLFLLLFEARSRYLYHYLPILCLAATGGLISLQRKD